MNSGDTAWVLASSALVLLMTVPALAFFYGGLVRRKNVLSLMMQCFIILCIISLQWILYGYSLTFGPDTGTGIIGGFDWVGLRGVGGQPNADYAATIPHSVFMIFQCMFAVITPVLKGARTGEIGDGKIFVLDLYEVIRIRTGERGGKAIG